jgi:hypothetical protein
MAIRKVFAIGLSRTGTTSLTTALRKLGLRAEHFPHDDLTRTEVTNFLRAPGDTLRLTLLNDVDALTDTPITATYQALDHAYPGSRFILTTRDQSSWLASCATYWNGVLRPLLASLPTNRAAYINLINRTVYGIEQFDPTVFAEVYATHSSAVYHHFRARPDDLLSIDVCGGEGWPRLCTFLNVAPPNEDFPHHNTSR